MMPRRGAAPGVGTRGERDTAGSGERTQNTTKGMRIELPLAPGTDALRRRLEQRDPPEAVIVIATDLQVPPGRDPRGVVGLAVLELTGDVDPVATDWSIVAGLPVTIVEDQLPCEPADVAEALVRAGAVFVRQTTLGTGPRRLR